MRPNKEIKPNRGFKKAFRAGLIVIICLSALISWITLGILRSTGKNSKERERSEEIMSEGTKDTIFIEKVKEIRVTDTLYKYLPPPKIQTVEHLSKNRDTISK
jgi:hypothetical protein